MKYKTCMVTLMMAVFIFSVSLACAADTNDTSIVIEEDNLLSLNDDEILTSEEKNLLVQTDDNETVRTETDEFTDESQKDILASEDCDGSLGADDNEDVIGASTKTYTDLFNLIYSNGEDTPATISLNCNYEFNNDYNRVYHGGINIKKNVVIYGNGYTIDGKNIMGHFTLAKTATLTIYNLNLINGVRDDRSTPTVGTYGSSILVPTGTKLIAQNCNFTNCNALAGGAIFIFSGNTAVTLTNCIFSNNRATSGFEDDDNGGGAICGSPDTLTVTGCIFRNNYAATDGGAIAVGGSTLNIRDSTFFGNSVGSDESGGAAVATFSCPAVTIENSRFDNNIITPSNGVGAVYLENSTTMTISNSNFTNNNVKGIGGALAVQKGGKLNIIRSMFKNNTANRGGAICLQDIDVNVQNSNFIENNALLYSGGAIHCFVGVYLTITKSNFNKNKASAGNGAGIYTESKLNVLESSFIDNNALRGSAICINNNPVASIMDSNFTNNNAVYGGAVYASATLEIKRSRFDNNKVSGTGAKGGAIINFGNLKIDGTTFNNNKAVGSSSSGGAIHSSNSLNIQNSVFAGSEASFGGAIYLESHDGSFIYSSNFTNNKAGTGGAIYTFANLNVSGSSFDNNKATNSGAGAIYASKTTYLSVINSNFNGNDAYNNGGAMYVLQTTNLIIINSNFVNHKTRELGGTIYAQEITNFNVKYSGFKNSEARVGAGLYIRLCSNSNVEYSYFKNNTADSQGIIYVLDSDFTINHSNVTDNEVGSGSLTCIGNKCNVNDVNFANNYASVMGGSISIMSSDLTVIGSRFDNNEAKAYGGVIYAVEGAKIIIKTSNFTSNTATGGGAIYANASSLNIDKSNFISNSGVMGGSIMVCYSADFIISKSVFNNNRVNYVNGTIIHGGAIFIMNSVLKINGSEFNDNYAKLDGGAIFATSSSTLDIVGSVFNNNEASRDGGAIHANIKLNVVGSDFTNNKAERYAGAIYSVSAPAFEIKSSTFDNNYALAGGATFIYGQNLLMSNNVFKNNRARYSGGAIYHFKGSSKLSLSYTNFTTNHAGQDGGAIFSTDATLNVDHAIFNHNDLKGIYANTGLVSNSIFMETDVVGGISESGNTHYTPSNFTFGFIPDSIKGNSITLTLMESHKFNGTVTVKMGTKSYTVSLQNGAGSRVVSDLDVGTYKAILNFPQTGEFFSSYSESNEFKVRYQTAFSIDSISDSIVGEEITLKVMETNGYTGIVSVKIGENSYSVTLNNGVGTTRVRFSAPGNYKAVIDFEATSQYTSAHAESNQFSVKYASEFTIAHISDSLVGQTIMLNVSEVNGYTGTVTVKIGEKSYSVTLNNGNGIASVSDLSVGTYKAVINFEGTAQYTSSNAQSNEFSVKYNSTFIFESISDALLGETLSIKVTETNRYTGDVYVKIGGKSYKVSLNSGEGTATVSDLGVGTYKATIDFEGTSQYVPARAESNLFTVKYNSTFEIGFIPTIIYGDSIVIGITESNHLSGIVTISVGTFTDTVELVNGVGHKTINPNLAVGKYRVVLNYNGSDEFVPATCQSNEFTVKYLSFIDLNDLIANGGSEIILEHDYAYDDEYDRQFINGIPIAKNVIVNGKGHFIDGRGLARIFDISNDAQVTLENITLINGKAEYGGAIYASNGTALIVVNSNFENNAATGEAGAIYSEGVLNISGSLFKNNVDAKGIGVKADNGEITNSTFIGNDVSGDITISPESQIQIDPSFVISTIPDFTAGSSITISVTESHGLNGTVVVTIGSGSYVIDIKNGKGSKTVTPNLAAGSYKATLTFTKSGKFNSASAVSNQFTVKAKPQPKPVKTTPKLIAGKKTFKLKVKVKKYVATLKTTKGKPIKNVKLTLKVKGKTYSAKTNKKGVVTFKIKNLKKKGKFTAVVKFAGNKDYNKVSKKVKITVK